MEIPFWDIMEENITNNLKRYNDKSKQKVIDEILNFNIILGSNLCLIIKEPKLKDEKWTVK